ncbi:MAG: AMP-binding protein, partial [Luteimonas sp.]|nr:AMP-binding protein [Luteimonas sp.]
DEVPRDFNYTELRAHIARAANLLLSNGARRGVTVALLLPNLFEQQFLFWGAQAAATALPLNHLLEPEHLAGLLIAAEARVLVALGPVPGAQIWEKALAVRDLMGDRLECVIQVGGPPDRRPGIVQYGECMGLASDQLDSALLPGPNDIAAIFHTGGTTGSPKLVQHTHRNELAAAYAYACAAELTPADVCVNGFPMFHVAGAICLSLGTYMAGAHLINLSAAGFRNPAMVTNHWQIVDRYGVTVAGAVATALGSIAEIPLGDHDISSLRLTVSGGALVPRTVAQRFEAASGVKVHEVYGMTEASAVICVEPARGERVLGSVGFAAPFVRVEIRELLKSGGVGSRLSDGGVGVLVVQGATVMPGYKEPRHNQAVLTEDGWLITGDLATRDPDGRITLLGRSKDLIIRGGHNIDPLVIEETAMSHPDVAGAAAVGEPDQYAGELPVCYVVLRPGASVTPESLADYIASRVPERPARPKRVYAVDALPLTGVGKVFKPALRQDAVRKVVVRQTEGLPIARVGTRDGPGGTIVVTIAAAADAHIDELRNALAPRLADFQFTWELVALDRS